MDVTTVEEIVETMEERFGLAQRIWVMDRGMVSAENLAWLQESGRRYLIGTARAEVKKWSRELAEERDWQTVREGVEAKGYEFPYRARASVGPTRRLGKGFLPRSHPPPHPRRLQNTRRRPERHPGPPPGAADAPRDRLPAPPRTPLPPPAQGRGLLRSIAIPPSPPSVPRARPRRAARREPGYA